MKKYLYILRFPEIKKTNKDIFAFFISLLLLLSSGIITWRVSFFVDIDTPQIIKDGSFLYWARVVILCLFTGVWEEAFFRLYILTIFKRIRLNVYAAVFLSSLLFALFHISSGGLSVLNAFISGIFLAGVFLKTASFYGIAASHAVYDILSFIFN